MLRDDQKTLPLMQAIAQEAVPFAVNRIAEVLTDFLALPMASIDGNTGSIIFLIRSVPATSLFYIPQATLDENKPIDKAKVLRKGYLWCLPLGLASNLMALTCQYAFPNHQDFLYAYAPGLWFTFFNIANQQWLLANGQQKTVLAITLFTGMLPTLLITQQLSPVYKSALGIAYSTSAGLQFLTYTLYFTLNKKFKDYDIFNFQGFFELDSIFIKIAGKGGWISLYAFSEFISVTLNRFFIGTYGDDTLIDLQPAQKYGSFLANWTFYWAMCVGAIIKRHQHLPEQAKRLGDIGAQMCVGFAGFGFIFLLAGNFIFQPFSDMGFYFLLGTAIAELGDGLRNAMGANLRSIGNTRFPALANTATVSFFDVLGDIIAKYLLPTGALGVLAARVTSIFVSSGLSYKKFQDTLNHQIYGDSQQPLLRNDEQFCVSRWWNRFTPWRKNSQSKVYEMKLLPDC